MVRSKIGRVCKKVKRSVKKDRRVWLLWLLVGVLVICCGIQYCAIKRLKAELMDCIPIFEESTEPPTIQV